jgi:hypothetical protein
MSKYIPVPLDKRVTVTVRRNAYVKTSSRDRRGGKRHGAGRKATNSFGRGIFVLDDEATFRKGAKV